MFGRINKNPYLCSDFRQYSIMDSKYIDKKIAELKAYAKKHGMEVRFRNHRTNQGDFCIFIYDRSFRPRSYAVGFDGDYESCGGTDFGKCLKQAYKEIDNPYWKK